MKKEKRKQLKLLRDSIEDRALLDAKITDTFLSSDLYKNADVLLLYYSVDSEVSTLQIFRHALECGKKTAFPICKDREGTMSFFLVDSEKDLTEGMYGIKSPSDKCTEFTFSKNALCIVPGLSYDKEGYRIGYGKGYYDRYLAHFSGTTVGLCYEQLVCDKLPRDIYDKNVNCLITDKKTYNFKSLKEDLKNG